MPIASKMRTLGDAGLYKYKWCNNLREVEQVNIFFLKDIADTIRYFIGNNIGFLYHNESKLLVCVPDSSIANVQHAVSQLFNSNIVVEYQNNTNLIEVISALLGEGNFSIKLDNDTQTLRIEFTLSTWATKMNDVENLLKRVQPVNLDVDILVDGVPAAYTQLEYLEGSGTQYINTLTYLNTNSRIETIVTPIASAYGNRFVGTGYYTKSNKALAFHISYNNYSGFTPFFVNGIGNYCYVSGASSKLNGTYHAVLDGYQAYWDDKVAEISVVDSDFHEFDGWPCHLFKGSNLAGHHPAQCRIHMLKIQQDSQTLRDFVPVLDANNIPCVCDKISRQCFYNSGTGVFGYRIKTPMSESSTFSLRDPYYTAPSGIWAKLITENELDIIADTDMEDGEKQGYIWFANTSEAYEYFGIKEEPLNNN